MNIADILMIVGTVLIILGLLGFIYSERWAAHREAKREEKANRHGGSKNPHTWVESGRPYYIGPRSFTGFASDQEADEYKYGVTVYNYGCSVCGKRMIRRAAGRHVNV